MEFNESRELIKSVRYQHVILLKRELGIHICTNGPQLQIHTHSKTEYRYLGVPPAGFLGFQSGRKPLVPDPPLESPDSPYFITGLIADRWSRSPRHSWARVKLQYQLSTKWHASSYCDGLKELPEVVVSEN